VSHMCHMPRPSRSSWFDHPTIRLGVQIIKLLVTESSSLPCYFIPLSPKYFLSNQFSNTLSLCSSLSIGSSYFQRGRFWSAPQLHVILPSDPYSHVFQPNLCVHFPFPLWVIYVPTITSSFI
jgi:hypothetical protein